MKHFAPLLLVFFIVIGCSKDDVINNGYQNNCYGRPLGIDRLSRFSTQYIRLDGSLSPSQSPRWYWRTYNDTIEVSGGILINGAPPTGYYYFFKKNRGCIDYLSMRIVTIDDFGFTYDTNGNVITHGFDWEDLNNLNFELQEYKQDELLVCDISGKKIWMEFTPDTFDSHIPDYLEFYQP